MKTLYSIFFLFVFSCFEIPTDPILDSDYSGLYFYPETLELSSGTSTQIEIRIGEPELSIFGLTFAIEYDPELLSYSNEDGYSAGYLFGSNAIYFAQADSGVIYITVSRTQGQETAPAIGLLGQIEFQAINPGETQIEFVNDYIFFYDSEGNEISVDPILLIPAQIQIK